MNLTAAQQQVSQGLRILVVEDMLTQAMRLGRLMSSIGVQHAKCVRNGAEAISVVKTEPDWDAVVSDINMPEMDGFELCRYFKSTEGYKKIPFILLVSLKDPNDVVNALSCGADNFLLKEFDKDYFGPRLLQALKNASISAQAATAKVPVNFNGDWRDVQISAAQVAAMLISTFNMAVHERAVRLYDSGRKPA